MFHYQLNDYRNGRMINIYNYSKRELISRFFKRNKLLVSMLSWLLISMLTGVGFTLHYAYQMNQAKNEAEQALVIITTFVERAQKQAHVITTTIRTSATALYSDLEQASNKLSLLSKTDTVKQNIILSKIQSEYSKIESFSIVQAKSLSVESSLGWKIDTQKYDAPIAKIQDGRFQIISILVWPVLIAI